MRQCCSVRLILILNNQSNVLIVTQRHFVYTLLELTHEWLSYSCLYKLIILHITFNLMYSILFANFLTMPLGFTCVVLLPFKLYSQIQINYCLQHSLISLRQ